MVTIGRQGGRGPRTRKRSSLWGLLIATVISCMFIDFKASLAERSPIAPNRLTIQQANLSNMDVESSEGHIPFVTPAPRVIACSTFYRVLGRLNSGKAPVIMLHGGPGGGHEYLLPFAALWTQHGIPVILYDQIGCAASTHLPHMAGNTAFWTVDLFVAELDNLINHFQLRDLDYHLFGHSWGGMLAVEYAIRRPQGLRRLVLASPIASAESNVRGVRLLRGQQSQQAQTLLDKAEKTGNWDDPAIQQVVTDMSNNYMCRAVEPPPELAPAWRHLSEDTTVYRTMYATSWLAPSPTATLAAWTSIPRLRNIQVPTLLYNGEYDTSHEVTTVPFFQLIPRVRWITFPNAGHMCHLEDGGLRERVLALVGNFLAQE